MKKAVLAIIAVIIIAACRPNEKPQNTNIKKADKVRVSLNGIPFAEATLVVGRFRKDSMSSHALTAVWLSRQWVDSVAALLTSENIADGFRIYFGKRKDGANTVVIVSTINDGIDTSESKADHLDYFGHASPFLLTKAALDSEDYQGEPGAALYVKEPRSSGTNCGPGTINNNISCHEAYLDVKNFKQEKINTRSEWFPIKLIQNLRDELDYNVATNNQDGIRIYFARNIDTATNPRHKNKHSFIIVTTQTVGNTPRVDYFDCYNPNKHAGDNGEQCLNNCNGATLPAP